MHPISRFAFASLVAACLACGAGCRSTDEYLGDISQRGGHAEDWTVRLVPYDSGQVIYEALAALNETQEFDSGQLAQALSSGGNVIEKSGVAVHRVAALQLLTRLALRVPLPPAASGAEAQQVDGVMDLVDEMESALAPLAHGDLIPGLSSPDLVDREAAYGRLQEVTGEDFGPDPAAWLAWWQVEAPIRTEAAAQAVAPRLDKLARARFTKVGTPSALLQLIASRPVWEPQFRAARNRAILRLGRQIVVLGIQRALSSEEEAPLVRMTAARSAREILDPSFGDDLVKALRREADEDVRRELLVSIRDYPSGEAVAALVTTLLAGDEIESLLARESLVRMTGEDQGESSAAWRSWYEGAVRSGRWR